MRKPILLCLTALVMLASCVPVRKIMFLQSKHEMKKKDPLNTVVRNYDVGEDFDYKIQPNDMLTVRFMSLTDKEFDVPLGQSGGAAGGGGAGGGSAGRAELVDNHGEIPMQVIGKVKVAGLTVFQAQDTLQKLANRFLESTIVRVRLTNYRVTILGEVAGEGVHSFQNNRVSLLEAIGQAGGLTELADRSHIKIIRQVDSKTEVFYVNVLKEDFINSSFYYVHQNDLIIVPPLRQRTFRKYYTQNLGLALSAVSVFLLILTLSKK